MLFDELPERFVREMAAARMDLIDLRILQCVHPKGAIRIEYVDRAERRKMRQHREPVGGQALRQIVD